MSYRILVVDDSLTIQKIFKIALSRHMTDVIVTSNLIEALNISAKHKADLLVIDANLPEIKGPAGLKRLQGENNNAPVLLLIGSHEPFDEAAYGAAGYHHYLRKPFESQDILGAIQVVLEVELPPKPTEIEPGLAPQQSIAMDNLRISDMAGEPNANHHLPPLPDAIRISMPSPVDSDLMTPPPLPPGALPKKSPFEIDETRRGRKAFQDPPTSTGIGFSNPSDDMPDTVFTEMPATMQPHSWKAQEATSPTRLAAESIDVDKQVGALREKLEEFLKGEAPVVVRKAVEKYCEAHFSQLARDILTSELRRLAEERARLLSN